MIIKASDDKEKKWQETKKSTTSSLKGISVLISLLSDLAKRSQDIFEWFGKITISSVGDDPQEKVPILKLQKKGETERRD